jgi:hypothetical protein
MTNDEAIEILTGRKMYGSSEPEKQAIEWDEAIYLAIQSLKVTRPSVKFRYCGKNIDGLDLYLCMGCGERVGFWNDAKPRYCSFCGAKGEVETYGI